MRCDKATVRFALGALVLVFSTALAGISLAQSGRASVGGYVTCEGCGVKGLADARIELVSIGAPTDKQLRILTDKYGIYEFRSVPMGDYKLLATSAGYETYEATLYVPSDSPTHLHIKLVKAGSPKRDHGVKKW